MTMVDGKTIDELKAHIKKLELEDLRNYSAS
jgi:hypothetical protein